MLKIKVLHIIKSLGRGGAEVLLPETLGIHDKKKFEFHYIYFLPWKDQMVDSIVKAGGKVTCFKADNNIHLLFTWKRIIMYCKKHEINIIHCHLPWSGFLGRIVHKKTGIPVIYTEHNIQERYHTITKWLNKVSFDFQSMALGVSKDVTHSIENNINPKIPLRTLLNGVNTSKFERSQNRGDGIRLKYKIPPNAVIIGNIAVFREQKRILDWIKVFRKILDNRPGVYGLLVGAGPQEENVKELIRELDLENHVILSGLQEDTISYFSAMDIFMMSSAFEGLPIALLEAMSMGCAVVSTKAGGVIEVIGNERDGLLVELRDLESLADKTLSLVDNVSLRDLYAQNGRRRIEESFSLQRMVEELESIYLEICLEEKRDPKKK